MKKLIYLLVLLSSSLTAQVYVGPIAEPTSGYGATGPYAVSQQSFSNPLNTTQQCQIFYPTGVSTSVPTVFFLHGFSGNFSIAYLGLFNHLASHGYAVVFAPYPATTMIQNNYDIMQNGFEIAARDFSSIIDTTRIGLIGYSFGGGASYYMADILMTQHGWGSAGRFISTIAPWYSVNTSNTLLANLPSDVKMQSFILQDDDVCDHRQAIEVYNNTPSILVSEKDVIYVPESTVGTYTYTSDHYSFVSAVVSNYDATDVYVFNRLIAALADYTFTGDLTAKDIALGGGSSAQVTLPTGLNNLVVVDTPVPNLPSSFYSWPCDSIVNPRSIYCDSITSVHSLELEEKLLTIERVSAHKGHATLELSANAKLVGSSLNIYNVSGSLVFSEQISDRNMTLNLNLPSGVYILWAQGEAHKLIL